MKKPDLNNFLPIDKIKVFSVSDIQEIETDLGTIVCRINHEKIDYETIDKQNRFDQSKSIITFEKINDLDKFVNTKFKEGFQDFEIELSKIGSISRFKSKL